MTDQANNNGGGLPRIHDAGGGGGPDNMVGSQYADRNESSSQSDVRRGKGEKRSRNAGNAGVKRDGFCDFFTRLDLLGSQIDMNFKGSATY